MANAHLTLAEREWLDRWRVRCDADPALLRHVGYVGYVEIMEAILAARLDGLPFPPGQDSPE